MNIGVLGTGMVGNAVGLGLIGKGYKVKMGSRSAGNPKALDWAKKAGSGASEGSFADAAAFGESIVFNCISGVHALDALRLAGADRLRGKILIELTNPLDFSKGMPPSLTVCNTDSLGEQIQRAFPDVRVVKTLNTLNCNVMLHPEKVPGDHAIYVSGNDAGAKAEVVKFLSGFGWKPSNIHDLGGIESARLTEMIVPLWVKLAMQYQNPFFNFYPAGLVKTV